MSTKSVPSHPGNGARTQHVLIDFENVQTKSLARLEGEHFRVHVFLGPQGDRLPRSLVLDMQRLGSRAEYVELESPGRNALDFCMAFHLGGLAAAEPASHFHIISKDTGFDPLIEHMTARKLVATRSDSIESMPCLQAKPVPARVAGRAAVDDEVESLLKIVVDDLVKRKTSRPRKLSTLRSTVKARIGVDKEDRLEAVMEALQARHVVSEGDKVSYQLPEQV